MRRAFPDLAVPVGVMDLFTHPTVRRLAELVATPEADRGPRRLLHLLTPSAARWPPVWSAPRTAAAAR